MRTALIVGAGIGGLAAGIALRRAGWRVRVFERAEGKGSAEAARREFNQQAVDVVYRALGDYVYVGGRYNRVKGRLAGFTDDVEADRWQFGGGIFLMNSVLMKLEYVTQEFKGYPANNLRNGGKFKGLIAEGVVAF